MTKSLRKHIEQHFTATLAAQSEFRRYEVSSPFLSRYDVAFTRMPRGGEGAPFIVLLFDHRGVSRISVEIGWSSDRQFPRLPIRPSGEASVGRVEFKEHDFLARLSSLWGEPDTWWEVDSEGDVSKAIGDMMSQLEKKGFPYIAEKEIAQEAEGKSAR